MNKKIVSWLWIILPLFFYTTCEYVPQKTNFVEIEKPKEVNYKVQIIAPINEKGEYVIKYSIIKFDFELPENIKEVYVRLYRENDNGYFSHFVSRSLPCFSTDWIDAGKYTLKCETPSSRTNTGSLAEIAGYEYYGKTFEWKLVLQHNPVPKLNLQYERLSDTTFKLSWDKPDPDYGTIDYYTISDWFNDPFSTTNETYVVTLSQWDSRGYYIRAYFKENYLPTLESSVYIYNY